MLDLDVSLLESLVGNQDEQQVQGVVTDTNYLTTDVLDATTRVAKLLLLLWPDWNQSEVDFPNKTNTLYEQWIDKCRLLGKRGRMHTLVSWLTSVRGDYVNYPVFLYNRGMWRVKEVLRFIMTDKEAPPYIALLFLNLFRQALGVSHDELHDMSKSGFDTFVPLYKKLMTTDVVWEWAAQRKQSLHFYGGQTNTLLGGYDAILNNPRTGIEFFNRDAAARFDVGGGFNTAEVERLVKCSFTSADIRSPYLHDYDDDLIMRIVTEAKRSLCIANNNTRQAYLERQNKVTWLPFDVYSDSFPDASSYAFMSTGFMTSTVRPNNQEARKKNEKLILGTLSTSFHALARVMEKVAMGKDVDLFTLQRASGRVYKYKTVLLQWRGGKVTRLVTTLDTKHNFRWGQGGLDHIYAAINPQNSYYLRLLGQE